MPKPVKVVLVLALLVGGADAARDFFTAADAPGSIARTGETINFWTFVALIVGVGGYLAYRRFRPRG